MKQQSAVKCLRKFLNSGDESFETWGLRDAKLLHLRPCKTPVVDVLKEHGPVARIHFL
jgi:hypothetical protein